MLPIMEAVELQRHERRQQERKAYSKRAEKSHDRRRGKRSERERVSTDAMDNLDWVEG